MKSRVKLYLTLAFTSLILLFYSIWQVKYVIVEPTDLLGLASQLPPFYWVGLAVILLCSILVFLDRKLKSDALSVFLLIVLGFFLFGISVFSQEAPRDPGAYYPSAEVKNLIQSHRIDISEPIPSYNSWPAIQLIAASTLEITGTDLHDLIRYFPLFWMLCFIGITYSIGKRMQLPSNLPFLLSFLALSSYWMMWSSFSPQSIAMLLYLLSFALLVTSRNTAAESLLLILTFGALLITHSIAALAVLLSLVVLSVYRRRHWNLVALFCAFFASWYMYQAVGMFEHGVTMWWTAPLRQIFQMTQQLEGAAGMATPQRMILRYSQLSYLALYFVGVIAAIALLWRRKVNKEDGKLIISCIFWIGGILGLALAVPAATAPVTDMLGRLYLYGAVAAACIVTIGLPYRKLLATLMILFVALHLPAHYGAEAAWGQVLPTELKGNEFFALQVKPQQPYFYNGAVLPKLIFFRDPALISVHYLTPEWDFIAPNRPDFSVMDNAAYVVFGRQGHDRVVWGYGEDAMQKWRETEKGKEADLIYNNGSFQIYANTKTGQPQR